MDMSLGANSTAQQNTPEVQIDGPLGDKHDIQERQGHPYREHYPQEHNFPGMYASVQLDPCGGKTTNTAQASV